MGAGNAGVGGLEVFDVCEGGADDDGGFVGPFWGAGGVCLGLAVLVLVFGHGVCYSGTCTDTDERADDGSGADLVVLLGVWRRVGYDDIRGGDVVDKDLSRVWLPLRGFGCRASCDVFLPA